MTLTTGNLERRGETSERDPVHFTRLLKSYRLRARLTQEKLAERAGLSIRSVRDIERGRVRHPYPETARLLGTGLGLVGGELEEFVLRARQGYWAGRQEPNRSGCETILPRERPAQLPPDIATFVGRQAQLRDLDELLGDEESATVAICALSGTAGVGKTAMAVHWAHRVAARFPDGQLYINLRGFDPRATALEPVEAVRGFLDALGVPPPRAPYQVEELVGLYRSVVAGRRLLILLDNARDAEQVRPLLPGAPGCVVVATSRDRLIGLVTANGARPLSLELLTQDEAWELLTRRLGLVRLAAEPLAVKEIVDRCARLPVALSIVAARAVIHPRYPLAAIADQLRTVHSGLDAFEEGDAATDVRTVFSCSYDALSTAAARMFRLLSLHPGQDISGAAAGSLAGVRLDRARQELAELDRAHLVAQPVPDQYTVHGLLRAYAGELVEAHDTGHEQRSALHRLLDHCLHTAHACARLLEPQYEPITLTPPQPGVTVAEPTSAAEATTMFVSERATMVAAVRLAHDSGFWVHSWQLAWSLATFLQRYGYWQDQAATLAIALTAAHHLADPVGLAHAHRGLARVRHRMARYDEARMHLHEALTLHRRTGDKVGMARAYCGLGSVSASRGHCEEGLQHNERALHLFRSAGNRGGEAEALNGAGWNHALRGHYEQALSCCEQALELFQEIGDGHGEGSTWDSLGYIHHQLGHHADAVLCFKHSLHLFRDAGERYLEAQTLTHFGDTHLAAGDAMSAQRTWRDALDILDELHHPDATRLRAKAMECARDHRWLG